MNCRDEDTTDAEHTALYRMIIFLDIILLPLKKVSGILKKFKTNYPFFINEINLAFFPLPEI